MRAICTVAAALAVAAALDPGDVHALDVVTVRYDAPAIRLTDAVERRQQDGKEWINVSAAPSPDGIIRRMSVRTRADRASSHWALVALANNGDARIERLLVASCDDEPRRFNLLPPASCPSQVQAVTASQGPTARRIQAATGDIFSLGLDPQSVTTFVIELAADRTPLLYLWQDEAYRRHEQDRVAAQHRVAIGAAAVLAAILALLSWTIWRRRRRS